MPTFGTKPHLITRYGTSSSPHHCLIDAAGTPLPSGTTTSSTGCIDAALSESWPPLPCGGLVHGCDQTAFQQSSSQPWRPQQYRVPGKPSKDVQRTPLPVCPGGRRVQVEGALLEFPPPLLYCDDKRAMTLDLGESKNKQQKSKLAFVRLPCAISPRPRSSVRDRKTNEKSIA